MRELSIFIDESGDFGEASKQSAYYLVTFVFHEQDKDISEFEKVGNKHQYVGIWY